MAAACSSVRADLSIQDASPMGLSALYSKAGFIARPAAEGFITCATLTLPLPV